ncbi:MAG: YceI family protein [Pseudomonadota bacterium]
MKLSLRLLPILLLGPVSVGLAATWEVDTQRSSLSFVSTKNVDIAEAHQFRAVTGTLDADGKFALVIDLKSVDTKIPIRDDRIAEHVFAGAEQATVSGAVDPAVLGDIGIGESALVDLKGELSFLGKTTPILARTEVSASAGRLQAVTREPVLLNMRVLGAGTGIEKLREIAGLTSISMAVPVYFSISLRRAGD